MVIVCIKFIYYKKGKFAKLYKPAIKQHKGSGAGGSYGLKLDNFIILKFSTDCTRPDCAYVIENGNINNLCSLTKRELREAHNIEKLYRANEFEKDKE